MIYESYTSLAFVLFILTGYVKLPSIIFRFSVPAKKLEINSLQFQSQIVTDTCNLNYYERVVQVNISPTPITKIMSHEKLKLQTCRIFFFKENKIIFKMVHTMYSKYENLTSSLSVYITFKFF